MLNTKEIIILCLLAILVLIIIFPALYTNIFCNTSEAFSLPSNKSTHSLNNIYNSTDSSMNSSKDPIMSSLKNPYSYLNKLYNSNDSTNLNNQNISNINIVDGSILDHASISSQKLIRDIEGVDPNFDDNKMLYPRASTKDYESLIFDNTTGAVMTGSQFMQNTGIVAPLWIPPAWDPDAYGPSSTGELNPSDYENDPRMLYNKCSLSCCGPQYPTPFQGTIDPFVCDNNGNNKYLSSNYYCQNNTGGIGCLCMTKKQANGLATGFVDYYANKKLGY